MSMSQREQMAWQPRFGLLWSELMCAADNDAYSGLKVFKKGFVTEKVFNQYSDALLIQSHLYEELVYWNA